MKAVVFTLGCKVNESESEALIAGLADLGYEVSDRLVPADLYIVNTCAVTAEAEKKSRQTASRIKRLNKDAKIIFTGCAAQSDCAAFTDKGKSVLVTGTFDKGKILSMLNESGALISPEKKEYEELPKVKTLKTRTYIKVQDGCDNFCAYCTVPFARGRSRNIPICECVKMAREIAAQGIKEVVLTGVNTGDFGRTTGESFLDLLKALNEVEGIERYRISSIEPNLITPEIVDWIASGTKFQRHFHIPLQSGSDTLLRRVGRRYDTALFVSRIDHIRQAMERPGEGKVFFGIDVIVGLPGETEELFQETYSFLKDRIRPAFIHVFPYSRRPGTRAAEWKDQVQDSVKTERVARLEELCAQLHADFVAANKGVQETVLWESSVKNGLMGGYTGNYIRVERAFDPARVNTLEEIEL